MMSVINEARPGAHDKLLHIDLVSCRLCEGLELVPVGGGGEGGSLFGSVRVTRRRRS